MVACGSCCAGEWTAGLQAARRLQVHGLSQYVVLQAKRGEESLDLQTAH